MDSPVMWMFDGQKFQQKETEATIYKLVGDVTTCMFCASLAQIVSPLLSTLNNLFCNHLEADTTGLIVDSSR